MTIAFEIHQDDGTGNCTTCGTLYPEQCRVETKAVYVAEVHAP